MIILITQYRNPYEISTPKFARIIHFLSSPGVAGFLERARTHRLGALVHDGVLYNNGILLKQTMLNQKHPSSIPQLGQPWGPMHRRENRPHAY